MWYPSASQKPGSSSFSSRGPRTHLAAFQFYLCAIKDVFSNRIVGWSDSRMKARLVVAAIDMAVARRGKVAGCILHSDRGSQFTLGRCSGP